MPASFAINMALAGAGIVLLFAMTTPDSLAMRLLSDLGARERESTALANLPAPRVLPEPGPATGMPPAKADPVRVR